MTSSPPPPVDLDAARALLVDVTPEPWNLRPTWGDNPDFGMTLIVFGDAFTGSNFIQARSDADAAFVARSRTLVPELIAEVEYLRAELARTRAAARPRAPGDGLVLAKRFRGNTRGDR